MGEDQLVAFPVIVYPSRTTAHAPAGACQSIEPSERNRLAPYGGRLVCGLPGFQRFDSLAVEASGNICVATLITGHITVIAPDGHVVRQVKMPDVYPTNICFGGSDMKTAYITLSGSGQLGAMDWPEPGLRLNFMA